MKKWLIAMLFASACLKSEVFALDVISYDGLIQNDERAIGLLRKALYEKGIVGVRDVPGYAEKLQTYIETARAFFSLPEEIKEKYAPNRELNDQFVGYEKGKEKFQKPDGTWVIDDLKNSYYGFVPEQRCNKWPIELDLQSAFQGLGTVMAVVSKQVMEKVDLIGPKIGISLDQNAQLGRMLYYQKSQNTFEGNPYWCGAHFDHSMFTALTPAVYFIEGVEVPEPEEAGLFVKIGEEFLKVNAEPGVILFQVGEFGQLVTNDAIRATEHRVHKTSSSQVERYAFALFHNAPMDTLIHSTSILTQDPRYGGMAGDPCTYRHWNDESFKRYLVKKENSDGDQ